MGEESTNLPSLKFPVLPLTMDSPEHPLQTRASVPFKWEEQPGKPRPCTDIIVRPEPVGLVLELPPCRKLQRCSSSSTTLLLDPYAEDKVTKTPSPTAVLDGPYNVGRPKFSSFRLFVTESVHDAVLESGLSSESPRYEEEGFVGKMMKKKKKRRKGLFGKFSGGKKEALGGGVGFSSSSRFSPFSTTTSFDCESDQESIAKSFDGKIKRNGSFSDGLSSHGGVNNGSSSSSSSSRFLASIYEGLKQVIHWNSSSSRKSSKEIHI